MWAGVFMFILPFAFMSVDSVLTELIVLVILWLQAVSLLVNSSQLKGFI